MGYETFCTIIGRCSARKIHPFNHKCQPECFAYFGGLTLVWQVERTAASANFDVSNIRTPKVHSSIDGYHDLSEKSTLVLHNIGIALHLEVAKLL